MKVFEFKDDVNGYYFSYNKCNVSQTVAATIDISTLKFHNIIKKYNGTVYKGRVYRKKTYNYYRFDTMEECKKAANELEDLLLVKVLTKN